MSLERSEIEVRQASVVLDRFRALAKDRVVSAAQREDAEYALELARARRREALAARRQAQRELTHTKIPAPFAGRVRSAGLDVGQYIARGEPLARIYAEQSAEVRLPIPDGELAFLDFSLSASTKRPTAGGAEISDRCQAVSGGASSNRATAWIIRLFASIAASMRTIRPVQRRALPAKGAVKLTSGPAAPSTAPLDADSGRSRKASSASGMGSRTSADCSA